MVIILGDKKIIVPFYRLFRILFHILKLLDLATHFLFF